jgi:hypothetical protein
MDRAEVVQELADLIGKGKPVLASAQMLSKKHSLGKAQILAWYYQDRPQTDHHGNSSLSFDQEQQLLFSVLAMSNNNLDWTLSQTQDFAKTILGVELTVASAYRFLKRHADQLTFQKSLSLGQKRTEDGLYESALFFAEKMEKYFNEKQFLPHQIVNYDESRICLSIEGKFCVHRLVSKSKVKPQHQQKVKGTHMATFLPFVTAAGEVVATYLIFSASFGELGEAEVISHLKISFSKTRRALQLSKMYWTDTGYLNKEVFSKIIDDFTVKWKVLYPGAQCCLIGDNLGIHRDLKTIEKAFKQSIYMCYLVAHTTHWSQPLDNLLFARLKQEVSRLTTTLAYQQIFSTENLFSLMDIVLRAAHIALSQHAIQEAFRMTGLCPFSIDKITALAYQNHPPPSSTFVPTSQHEYFVKKTTEGVKTYLQTIKNAGEKQASQMKTVRHRVRKNEGYDPESILQKAREDEEATVRARREKEQLQQQRQEERTQKKRQREQEKEERAHLRQKKQVEKEQRLEKQKRYQKSHTCYENCGAKCRTGPQWVGCSWCDEYWVCPKCYLKPAVKARLSRHEKRCEKLSEDE